VSVTLRVYFKQEYSSSGGYTVFLVKLLSLILALRVIPVVLYCSVYLIIIIITLIYFEIKTVLIAITFSSLFELFSTGTALVIASRC
jgi:hypothetical protein